MSSGLTPEEQFALRSDFGLRLSNSMKQNGPLCVGIDPHRKVLSDKRVLLGETQEYEPLCRECYQKALQEDQNKQ